MLALRADPRTLAGNYPSLVRHAIEHFKSSDVMRFLGGKVHGNFTGEIVTSFKNRREGVRVAASRPPTARDRIRQLD